MISLLLLTLGFFFFCFSFLSFLYKAAPTAHVGSQARGKIGVIAAGLCHSQSNAGSEPFLWPTPQLMAMLDPYPTERSLGSKQNFMATSQIHFFSPQWEILVFFF